MYLQTRGLVLQTIEYRDSDRLLTVLTADHGKITLKAGNIKKPACRYKSAGQLLAYASYTAVSYKGKWTITEAETIETFQGLRLDLERLSLGSWFAQAVQTVADADAPSPELLQLILTSLYALSRQSRPNEIIKAAFEFRLTCLAGFLPDLNACRTCGNENPDGFDISRGVLCCMSCRKEQKGLTMPVSPGVLQALRYLTVSPAERLLSFSLPKPSAEQLGQITEAYLTMQFQRDFSALNFYKQLFRIPGSDKEQA